jgi:apolipoprotein N-acyltransferase
LVNAKGELVESLPMFVPEVLKADVDILDGQTYYVRYGDWFAWSMTIIVAAILLLDLKRVLTHKRVSQLEWR